MDLAIEGLWAIRPKGERIKPIGVKLALCVIVHRRPSPHNVATKGHVYDKHPTKTPRPKLRKEKGLTQEEVGAKLGVSPKASQNGKTASPTPTSTSSRRSGTLSR